MTGDLQLNSREDNYQTWSKYSVLTYNLQNSQLSVVNSSKQDFFSHTDRDVLVTQQMK